jgi:hypothetical protein
MTASRSVPFDDIAQALRPVLRRWSRALDTVVKCYSARASGLVTPLKFAKARTEWFSLRPGHF